MKEDLQERFMFKTKEEYQQFQAAQRQAKDTASRAPTEISDVDRRRARFKGGIAERAIAHYEQKYG